MIQGCLLETLTESGAVPDTVQMVDSTVVRAHHCAAGAKGASSSGSWTLARWPHNQDPPPGERAGPASWRRDHARRDARSDGLPRALGRGRAGARRCSPPTEATHRRDPLRCGEQGRHARDPDQAQSPRPDRDRRRDVRAPQPVERAIGHLKNARRVATRLRQGRRQLPRLVQLAAIRLWLRHFVDTA